MNATRDSIVGGTLLACAIGGAMMLARTEPAATVDHHRARLSGTVQQGEPAAVAALESTVAELRAELDAMKAANELTHGPEPRSADGETLPPGSTSVEPFWHPDWGAAYMRANSDPRQMVLVYLTADWCEPCQKIEAWLTDPRVLTICPHDVLCKLDADGTINGVSNATAWGVERLPAMIWVSPDGAYLDQFLPSAKGVDGFLESLAESRSRAVSKLKGK